VRKWLKPSEEQVTHKAAIILVAGAVVAIALVIWLCTL